MDLKKHTISLIAGILIGLFIGINIGLTISWLNKTQKIKVEIEHDDKYYNRSRRPSWM